MGCPKGGAHDYRLIEDVFICSKCSGVSPYKPEMSHSECLEKYEQLLEKCHELAEDEINLNDFKVWLLNQ